MFGCRIWVIWHKSKHNARFYSLAVQWWCTAKKAVHAQAGTLVCGGVHYSTKRSQPRKGARSEVGKMIRPWRYYILFRVEEEVQQWQQTDIYVYSDWNPDCCTLNCSLIEKPWTAAAVLPRTRSKSSEAKVFPERPHVSDRQDGIVGGAWSSQRNLLRKSCGERQTAGATSFVAASVLRPIAAGAPPKLVATQDARDSSEDKQRRTWLGTYFFWKSEKKKKPTFSSVSQFKLHIRHSNM